MILQTPLQDEYDYKPVHVCRDFYRDPIEFLFLGANQDAIANAGRMNIQEANTANFAMTGDSYKSSKAALSRKMSAVRRRSQGDTDAATVHDAEAPLETLREEEERKGNE